MEDQFLIVKKEDLKELLSELLDKPKLQQPDRFINESEAMRLLNCKKTTLYHLRVSGDIGFVQNEQRPKMILYDRESIISYLEQHLKKSF